MKNLRPDHSIRLLSVLLLLVSLTAGCERILRQNDEVAKKTKVNADLSALRTQLLLYDSMNGFVPTTEQGLNALIEKPTSDPQPPHWAKMMDEVPRDPWEHEYVYRSPGSKDPKYDLFSSGPDGVPGNADDLWLE